MEVPVNVARKSSRPGSVTLISGSLYGLLSQHVGSTAGEPGFSVKTNDALFAVREWDLLQLLQLYVFQFVNVHIVALGSC